jgi:hypothetical protein
MIIFKLKKEANSWYIYSPKGFVLSGPFVGVKDKAIEWAKAYISSWLTSTLEVID